MNVWQWTCPALGTGSVLTPWARTAVSVTRAGPGVNATWTFTSAPSSSPVNTTPPVSRCRAATGVNAYLDSRGNTVKEVRLYLSSLKCKVSLRIFMYNFLGFFLRKVDNSIQSFAFYERCMYSFNIYSQYTGKSLILNAACDFFVDEFECASNPCLNGATCMETFGSFYCSCPPGWTGPRCNEGRDYIPSSCSLEYCKPSINSFVFNLQMAN